MELVYWHSVFLKALSTNYKMRVILVNQGKSRGGAAKHSPKLRAESLASIVVADAKLITSASLVLTSLSPMEILAIHKLARQL
jgi:hypothetical protein